MRKFSFMLKSYAGDFKSAEMLISSFNRHNVDSLSLDIVVPESDVRLFSRLQSPLVTVISEETIPTVFADGDFNGFRPGYINQQIVKLAFGRLGLTESYMCLDSDGLFLNDFRMNDFIHASGFNYTTLVEDRTLKSEPHYYSEHWKNREKQLSKIAEFLDIDEGKVLLTCHGFQIMNAFVLQKMTDQILSPRGWDYIDLLGISPYEFNWYNFFIQNIDFPLHVREPYFYYVHNGWQYASELLLGFTEEDWARGYLGIVLNSNFQLVRTPQTYGASRVVSVAMYMGTQDLLKVLTLGCAALIIKVGASVPIFVRRTVRSLARQPK